VVHEKKKNLGRLQDKNHKLKARTIRTMKIFEGGGVYRVRNQSHSVFMVDGYESLNFYLRLILLTMVLRSFHDHHTALEYHGKIMILLLWEKKLYTKFKICS
jgi:hypothetical protein